MLIIRIFYLSVFFCLLSFSNIAFSQNQSPQLFLFLEGDEAILHADKLANSCVSGAQIIYSWKQLEPQKDVYDFSKIEKDLKFLNSIGKKLFIQLQDRSFQPTIFHVPDYIREDVRYHGGVAMQYDFPGEGQPISTGWVARQWDPAVAERFKLLIQTLASHYDGKIYGINLPETAVDFNPDNLPLDFTYDNYFHAVIKNINLLRKYFQKSNVIQYVNFFPGEWNNDHQYMSRLFTNAIHHQIGLGGPDTVPYRPNQMKNSYPFFQKYKDKLLVGMAVQEGDYTYTNPETGNHYTFSEFYHFTKDYLGASIIFWNVKEPFYSNQLTSQLNKKYFNCN